jgi:hypothetical protein
VSKPDGRELVCARCRLKVNIIGGPAGTVFRHAGALDSPLAGPGRTGHDPVPVVMPSGSAILMCDFCDARHPPWAIPLLERAALTIEVAGAGTLDVTDDGWWAACDECLPLVEGRKIRALRARSLAGLSRVTGSVAPEVAEALRLRQAAFWLGKPGPALPMIRG